MNCKDIEILLQLAADNEATEAELTAIDAHLDACLICRRKEAWLELLNERFGEVLNPSIEDSPGLADAVVDALNASQLAEDPKQLKRKEETPKSTLSSSRGVPRKRNKKRKLLNRIVFALWSRQRQKRAKQAREQERAGWLDASVTSLEGFRAAKQGVSSAVSGPARAFRWVADAMPLRGRREG